MRDGDRFWWLLVLAGVAFWVVAAVVPYHLVQTAPTPAENQFVTNDEYRGWIGAYVFLGLVLLGFGVTLIVMAFRNRGRHLLRLAAFAGDERAMPLANIHTDTTRVPDVEEQPLELMWRSSRVTSFFYILLFIVQGLAVLLSVGIALYAFADTLVQPAHPLGVWEIVLYITGIVALLAIIVGLVIAYVRVFSFLLGRSFGVTATEQGIDARTEFGSRLHMAWDEARLLEAVSGDANAFRRFSLYASGKRIGWAEYMTRLGGDYVPAHISSSEMTLRQTALLNLVVARTGLPLRTLAKSLQSKPAPARTVKRSPNAVALLVFALILAGIAVVDFFFPVTPVPWLNWVSTGSLAFLIVCLIIASLWTALARSALPAHASPPSVGAPSFDAPGVVYVLSWRPPQLRRLALICIGLCLAFNLIPSVLTLLLSFGLSLPGSHPQFLSDGVYTFMGRFVLGFVLALVGLVGLAMAYGGMIVTTFRIRADKDGLTTGSGRRQQIMAWSSVQDISWGSGGRGQFTYLVKSDVPTFQISWSAGPQAANVNPPGNGAIPIGGDELAALVAARIGKPIRVREGGGIA